MTIAERDPVREFVGDHHRLARTLLQTLKHARLQAVEELARIECKSFDEYRARKGKIEGLDIAIKFCEEAQRKLEA